MQVVCRIRQDHQARAVRRTRSRDCLRGASATVVQIFNHSDDGMRRETKGKQKNKGEKNMAHMMSSDLMRK